MCTIGPVHFMGLLAAFYAKQQGIELTLIDGTAEKLNELLRSGWLDLAILARPEPFQDSIQAVPLYQERFCVAFALGHKFQGREMIKMDIAAKQPHLLRVNCEYRPSIFYAMSRSGNRYSRCLSERERRLDPEHGGSRFWCYVFARVFRSHSRRNDPAFDKVGGAPGSFTGLDVWP